MTRPWRTAALCGLLMASPLAVAHAELLLYEPFNYTVGANLGGVDPDGPGAGTGTPVGQAGSYVGGGTYTWHARGSGANFESQRDAAISSGNLTYPGLATSQGNLVSYGSGQTNTGTNTNEPDATHRSLYSDSVALPAAVDSGSLYASFIIRIKSDVENGLASADRHSPVALVSDLTDNPNGAPLGAQSSSNTPAGTFFIRRDPDDATLGTSNFSPGKSSGDGIGPAAAGPSVGWQRSVTAGNVESNQFGDVDGQADPTFAESNTWQTYFVVLKYEFDAIMTSATDFDPAGSDPNASGQSDTVSLWINPGSETLGQTNGEILASQAASGDLGSYFAALDAYGTATSDISAINSFALISHRQITNETIAVDLDELRIGTTWADVTPTAPVMEDDADFDGDGDVDGADFLTWQRGLGTAGDQADGDADGNGQINGADLAIWRQQFGPGAAVGAAGAVPEPGTALLAAAGLLAGTACRRYRKN